MNVPYTLSYRSNDLKHKFFFCASFFLILTGCQSLGTSSPQSSQSSDLDVCFSPTEACDEKLIHFIRLAQQKIDVAVFDITLDALVHLLLVKARSLPVRVLVDRRQAAGKHSLVKTLWKGKIPIRLGKQRGVMHHKFVLLDGQALQTGSFNYTFGAARLNQENQLYLFPSPRNQGIIKRFQDQFEESWRDATPFFPKENKK